MFPSNDWSSNELLAGIRRWVEIESPSSDAKGVNQVMTDAQGLFLAAGARVERIPGRDGFGDHLRVVSPWGGDVPGILILCHLDTVHPHGTLAGPLPFRVDGDHAYGPGIYDMKGGAYLAFAAFAAAARAAATGNMPPLPVRLLYVSDEEVGSPTSRSLIEAEGARAKYVLVMEPARDGGKVVIARKGVARYEIETIGRAAHAGARHADGRSSILEMARQITVIEAMTDYGRGVTLNVGTIAGGTAENVVPQHCRASLDMRVRSLEDAEAMDRRLKSLRPVDPDVVMRITGGLNRPPFEQSEASRALFEKARVLAREVGLDLEGVITGGGSDGTFVAHKTATLDGLGVDGDGAHTHHEHLLVSSLASRVQLLKRLVETLE